MNSSQMLRKIAAPKLECCDSEDFAASSGLSTYACIKQRTCPICGSRGSISHYGGEYPTTLFFCATYTSHMFELDEAEATADRIEP